MYQVLVDGERRPLKTDMIFSGGEVQVGLQILASDKDAKEVIIMCYPQSSNDVMAIALLKNAVDVQFPNAKVLLSMPYVPYARQDRVMNKGEALGAKVLCDMINHMKFSKVTICDPHSDVTSALLNNVEVEEQHEIFMMKFVETPLLKGLKDGNRALLCPDAGAAKKISKLQKKLGCQVVAGEKVRNTQTGEITGTVIHDSDGVLQKVESVVIVDDICDGGRTFTELAKAVKKDYPEMEVILYVTHGIFSRSKQHILDNGVDNVYAAFDWEKVAKTGSF